MKLDDPNIRYLNHERTYSNGVTKSNKFFREGDGHFRWWISRTRDKNVEEKYQAFDGVSEKIIYTNSMQFLADKFGVPLKTIEEELGLNP